MNGTFWPAVNEPHGKRFDRSLGYIIERFRTPIVSTAKLRLPGFAFSTFRDDYRDLENHEASHAIGFDLDGPGTDLDVMAHEVRDLCGLLYTSYRHTAAAHRGRAQLFLDRGVSAREYSRLWRFFLPRFPTAGRQSRDASRLWFMPGIPPGGEYRLIELGGALIDVDATLALYPETVETATHPAPVIPMQSKTDAVERARRYLETCDIAISGSGGHARTFLVAQKMVRGFVLDEDVAYSLLTHWNARCEPPWTERELRRKVHEAAIHGSMPWGFLLERTRAA
jgi:hypothetical protein